MKRPEWKVVETSIEHLNRAGHLVVECICIKGEAVVADGDDDNLSGDGMFMGEFCRHCKRTYRVVIEARETLPEERRYRERQP